MKLALERGEISGGCRGGNGKWAVVAHAPHRRSVADPASGVSRKPRSVC